MSMTPTATNKTVSIEIIHKNLSKPHQLSFHLRGSVGEMLLTEHFAGLHTQEASRKEIDEKCFGHIHDLHPCG